MVTLLQLADAASATGRGTVLAAANNSRFSCGRLGPAHPEFYDPRRAGASARMGVRLCERPPARVGTPAALDPKLAEVMVHVLAKHHPPGATREAPKCGA